MAHRVERPHHVDSRKRVRRADASARHLPVPPEQLLAVVAAADLDALSNAAFRALATAVACDCVSVFYQNAGDHLLQERDSKGRHYGAQFTDLHSRLSPAIPIAMANPGIKLVPTRTGLPHDETELRESDFYRQIMRVQGWRHAVALCFWDGPPPQTPVLVFTVKRAEGAADFSDEDLANLETMHAFMEPAVRRLCERATAAAVVDAIATPLRHDDRGVAVLDSKFRVVRANLAARRLLTRSIPPAVVAACHELNEERLQRIRDGLAADIVRRRLVTAIAGRSSVEILITMVFHEKAGVGEPSFVIELAEQVSFQVPEGAPLPGLPGLTTAERKVAVALADGLSNQEIADRLGRSVSAVKFHLHQIYRKTGIPNRAGLAARVRSIGGPRT